MQPADQPADPGPGGAADTVCPRSGHCVNAGCEAVFMWNPECRRTQSYDCFLSAFLCSHPDWADWLTGGDFVVRIIESIPVPNSGGSCEFVVTGF